MYLQYSSELERPSPTLEFFFSKEQAYKLSEMVDCWKGVGVAHSTYNDTDNKTVSREGAILYSSF